MPSRDKTLNKAPAGALFDLAGSRAKPAPRLSKIREGANQWITPMADNAIFKDVTSTVGGITGAIVALTAFCTAGASLIVAGRKFWQQLKMNEHKIEEANKRIEDQQIRLNKMVETSMSNACFHHLAGIYLLHRYEYLQDEKLGELFQREFYFLKNRGFIEPETVEFDERLHETNIAEKVWPTETGKLYIELRKKDVPPDWLSVENRNNLKIEIARKLGLTLPR
jgi:hypothetical protein